MSLTLHACPTFSIPQYTFVIDFPPYFALYLSREFTAKIGGYLSTDWSHMLFRTRYGTKITIRFELLSKGHIESYTPNVINAICIALDQMKDLVTQDTNTQVDGIPNVLLDQWAIQNSSRNKTNDISIKDITIVGLGNYVFQDAGLVMPNLIKKYN